MPPCLMISFGSPANAYLDGRPSPRGCCVVL
jgi:hypothetical protein